MDFDGTLSSIPMISVNKTNDDIDDILEQTSFGCSLPVICCSRDGRRIAARKAQASLHKHPLVRAALLPYARHEPHMARRSWLCLLLHISARDRV